MECPYCKTTNKLRAKFCSNCKKFLGPENKQFKGVLITKIFKGSKYSVPDVEDNNEFIEGILAKTLENQPVLYLQPHFSLRSNIGRTVLLSLFFGLLVGVLIGGLILAYLQEVNRLPDMILMPFLTVFIVSSLIYILLEYIFRYFEYKKTKFLFYRDRLEYSCGSKNIKSEIIPLSKIEGVTYYERLIQKSLELATIKLLIPSRGEMHLEKKDLTSMLTDRNRMVIYLKDIKNGIHNFRIINDLVDRASSEL